MGHGFLQCRLAPDLYVAELHTTWGNPAFKHFVADSGATVARRLKQGGAIIAGKTNVAFLHARRLRADSNELYGVTNDPWDTTRTPGGSTVERPRHCLLG